MSESDQQQSNFPRGSSFKITKALKNRASRASISQGTQPSSEPPVSPEPKRQFPIEPSDYKLLEEIGAGGASTVYRARCIPLNEEVAVKLIDLEQHAQSVDEIRKEIAVMSQCHHANIVTFHTSFVSETMLWLVMECLEGGSCYDLMRLYYTNGFKNEDLIAAILKQVLYAVHYFHSQGQIHRDIKASNILIANNGCVRLADFGVAAFLVESGSRRKNRQTFVGTPCWMAPEVMEQVHGYDYKADIWSLGITALELAKGHAPFATYPPMKVLLLTLQNPPPTLDDSEPFSRHFKDFIDQCLRKTASKRPSAAKLLEHKFFRNVKKPEEIIKKELIHDLPSLGERARLLRQKKAGKDGEGKDNKKEEQKKDYTKEDDEDDDWVFSQDSESEDELSRSSEKTITKSDSTLHPNNSYNNNDNENNNENNNNNNNTDNDRTENESEAQQKKSNSTHTPDHISSDLTSQPTNNEPVEKETEKEKNVTKTKSKNKEALDKPTEKSTKQPIEESLEKPKEKTKEKTREKSKDKSAEKTGKKTEKSKEKYPPPASPAKSSTSTPKKKKSKSSVSPEARSPNGQSNVSQSPKVQVRGRFTIRQDSGVNGSGESNESNSTSTSKPDDNLLINQVNHLVWQNKEQNKMLKSLQEQMQIFSNNNSPQTPPNPSDSIFSQLAAMEERIKTLVAENQQLRDENKELKEQLSNN